MQKINIFNLQKSDIPELVKLEKLYFSEPWSEKSFLESLSGGNSYFAVAKTLDDIIAGYAGMYFAGGEGYVCNIAVREEFRRQKIAQTLIKNLIEYSLNKKLDFLSLEVRESNIPAINLYKKMNFEVLGKRKNFYNFPKENAVIMTHFFKKQM